MKFRLQKDKILSKLDLYSEDKDSIVKEIYDICINEMLNAGIPMQSSDAIR